MLQITDLTVRYGSIPAVRGVTVEVAEGELVTMVGPNGAGKSSTMRAVAGLEKPAGGTITFDGRPIGGLRPEQVVAAGLALVPEGRHIFGGLTVKENLSLGAVSRRDRKAVAADLERELERFPILRERIDQAAGFLSGGEQQQLAIARALMSRPQLLLLDEPSLGLAPRMVDSVFATIESLRADGITILLVEQNATRAVAMSDRYYLLRTGEVVRSGLAGPDQVAGLAEDYLAGHSDKEAAR
ncbi:ATP-binding cassette domain-containing protein [Nakamurella sp. YIM 132087]|uniref:ATP-binding cassette domain-containing protein n=1 Tax=Nakamurella alba TaxID=2665158 RepID=A0A7K1FF79_9ACTN|nr:ABC transporter ATP-binding protein [Nakamurella alba]MTD12775.1 ATP-binding cassette domain-containing protein [Nakamurella alba]